MAEWSELLAGYVKPDSMLSMGSKFATDFNFSNILLLAYQIKSMEDEISEDYLEDLESLKADLPEVVRCIVWEEAICLRSERNKFNDPYLFAQKKGGIFEAPYDDQKLYTLTGGEKIGEGFDWCFESDDDGETFFIKNLTTGEYLIATDEPYTTASSSTRAKMAETKEEDAYEFKWILDTFQSATKFAIRNVKYQKGLCSWDDIQADDGSKHYVVMFDAAGIWKIEKC